MLIEFSVSNFRSICEKQVISLVPAFKQKEHLENIRHIQKHKILNGTVLYGANSSGKSNLLKAIELIDKLLYLSTKMGSTEKLPYEPFLLKEGYASEPTTLEIIFITNEIRYRYGVSFNSTTVLEEWLFRKKVGREVELFNRFEDTIEVSSGFKGSQKAIDTAIEATRENALFLSFCDMLNVTEAKHIFRWFKRFIYIDGLNAAKEEFQTIELLQNEDLQQKTKAYLNALGLGFEDIIVQRKEFDALELPQHIDEKTKQALMKALNGKAAFQINTVHALYDKDGVRTNKYIHWPMDEHESEGTKKTFRFSGPVIHTLLNGGLLVVDEIEAKIHPVLTLNIINLFLSEKTNPLNAQIIFSTHDTNLLSYAHLRRDQINFVEKNTWEATEIYTLSDFRYFNERLETRADENKEKRYLEGRYGAIPFLSALNHKIGEWYGKTR
ncbi:MAG: AAA family ATPase [Chitinophagales bacterium]